MLLVGANKKVLKLLADGLEEHAVTLRTESSWDRAMLALEEEAVDVLIADSDLESDSGLEFCMSFQGRYPGLVKILLVDRSTLEVLDAQRRGFVQACLEKPVSAQSIVEAVQRITRERG